MLETFCGGDIAPLARWQLAHRHAAQADAAHADDLQASGFAQRLDLPGCGFFTSAGGCSFCQLALTLGSSTPLRSGRGQAFQAPGLASPLTSTMYSCSAQVGVDLAADAPVLGEHQQAAGARQQWGDAVLAVKWPCSGRRPSRWASLRVAMDMPAWAIVTFWPAC
jgi:hypothetical protein